MGGASGETEEKEVFTDEPEVEEEKEQPATTAGVPEVENGFSDGENVCGLVDNGTAAENINQGQKHIVHIKNVEPFPIERQTIVDIINNHDGTVTIGVDPDVYIGDQKDTGKYKVMYYQASVGIGTDGKNPESNDTQQMFRNNQYLYVPVNRKIGITEKFINIFLCIESSKYSGYYYEAAVQNNIVNPTKVVYDLDGGTDGPPTDWVWSRDCQWGNGHEKIPQKTGYRFDGWYTGKNGQGNRIDSVQDISYPYPREITLYAKWVHVHSWNYSLSGDTLKAYCSNANSPCEYYGTGSDNAQATVSLKLNGFDNNNCAEYGSTYSVTCDNTSPSEIGATIGSIIYAGRDGTTYPESSVLPTSTGKYKAKVNIALPGEQNSKEISADFEIKPRPAQLNWSSSELTYNGQLQTVTARVRNALSDDTFKLTYVADEIYTNTGKNARKYTAKVTALGNTNYSLSEDESVHPWEIKKAPVTLTVVLDEFTYGEQPVIKLQGAPSDSKVIYQYKVKDKDDSTYVGITEEGLKKLSAGEYTLKAVVKETENYKGFSATCDFNVKKASATDSYSKVDIEGWTYGSYDGKKNAPSIASDLNPENQTVQYTYYTDGACTTQTSTENGAEAAGGVPKNAGTYYVKAQIPESANYNAGTATGSFEIKPKEVTVKPDDLHKHIGGEEPQLTYTTDGIVEGETLSGITLQRVSGEDARKYEITATETAGANPNYTVTREKGTFTIEDHNWPKDGKILSPATSWSEGMQERTCTAPGCGQKRYDSIPKQDGKPADPYADKIDKYIQIFGSEITAAALDNEETILFGLFPGSDKTRIDNGSGAKVWLEINHVNNLDPAWQNLINMEIEKTVGKNADQILFDIDLYRQLAGENRVLITNPGINMNIRIKIPDKMINNQPYTIRDYKILRLHKDSATNQATVDILDSVFNSSTNELTFKSDKFSIYVLTYKDTYYSPSYPVTGIKVSPDTLTLTKKDETAQLTAEVTPSYADNKRVTWQSSDEKVATVDENGKVTAVGNGTATITATSVSGSYTATVSVTVKIPVEIQKLTIEAEKETLTKIGESTELKVKIEPENADLQKLIWKSDNEKVATTDENGKVTAVGNGTAEITVTTEDGKITASIMITVKVPDEPTINKTTGFRRLRARSVKQTKTSVTLQWNIIKDADGYFIYGNRCNTGTKSYKYRKLATITGGDISTWTQKDLKKGTYYKYVVKAYRLVNGKKVVTDTSISVHAVTGGGKYGNAKAVSVTQIGNKRNVSKITLKMGKTAQIKAKEVKKDKKIERHRKLCYESSNTKVATVTPDGLIRATGKGTCTIWVYAQNGIYKALKITVK
ncbi:Ig-like domain-containing protein [Blautia sp. DFI.1.216]|uniref:Ig-like domain-containing protein n=1 Tax=Blautia sp. DFI.1.216 TaxID=2885264 RepID=UPI001D09E292|nr:Ig-like domain-containing protein [Blautia sp. DFI.1.216]MCB8725864.1 Ig-like domain-containing protein [Blautia sp. DFI.1.216]